MHANFPFKKIQMHANQIYKLKKKGEREMHANHFRVISIK